MYVLVKDLVSSCATNIFPVFQKKKLIKWTGFVIISRKYPMISKKLIAEG